MIKYYKLFDLLNRRGMKKSDLRQILAPKTIAKLSKGQNVETDVINKICLYLGCQPSDIMEVITEEELYDSKSKQPVDAKLITKRMIDEECDDMPITETYLQTGDDEPELIERKPE